MKREKSRKSYERVILLLQTIVFLVVIVVAVGGCFKRGIWSKDDVFYEKKQEGNACSYYDSKKKITVTIANGETENEKKILFEKGDMRIEWKAYLEQNGTYQNIKLADEKDTDIWSGSYQTKEETLVGNGIQRDKELDQQLVAIPFYEDADEYIDITVLCKMLGGNVESRTVGRIFEVMISLLVLMAGFLIVLCKEYLIKLD